MSRLYIAVMSFSILTLLAWVKPGGAELVSESQMQATEDREAVLLRAIDALYRTQNGKILIGRALKFWGADGIADLPRFIRWGSTSRTDAVLTRHFDSKTGTESRERQVTIYVKESQAFEETVLDIAHEMIHATSRPAWDPYDPKLTAGRYIWSAIEGEGGEVEAIISECKVGLEFAPSAPRCKSYLSSDGEGHGINEIDREKVRKDFYRVGDWKKDLLERLGAERAMFPFLSGEAPRLYSSTGHAPYPVALLREFEDLTQIACENSRKRIRVFGSRRPASGTPTTSVLAAPSSPVADSAQQSANAFIAERCTQTARTVQNQRVRR